MAADAAPSPPLVIDQRPGCIAVGWSGVICKINDTQIIKHPKYFPGNHPYNEQSYDLITLERNIYERLGDHKGIIKYLGIADTNTGAIKLAYAKQGDLSTYIQTHDMPPDSFRTSWIQLLIETFYHIYRCKVLHQDITLNNILVDEDCLKVVDFANGALFPLDADMEAICAEDPLSRVDLLCLGCVMYSIATWQVFFYDYFEMEYWPILGELPSTSDIIYGNLIRKCWEDEYSTIASLHGEVTTLSGKR